MKKTVKPFMEIRLVFDTVQERDEYKKKFEKIVKKAGYVTNREWLRAKIREEEKE